MAIAAVAGRRKRTGSPSYTVDVWQLVSSMLEVDNNSVRAVKKHCLWSDRRQLNGCTEQGAIYNLLLPVRCTCLCSNHIFERHFMRCIEEVDEFPIYTATLVFLFRKLCSFCSSVCWYCPRRLHFILLFIPTGNHQFIVTPAASNSQK